MRARQAKPCWPFTINRDSPQSVGLVGWWPGGPLGGPRLFDMSGRGNHGTLTNFASPFSTTSGWAQGKDGGGKCAIVMDGSDDYVAATVAASISAYSFSCWLRYTGATPITNFKVAIMYGSGGGGVTGYIGYFSDGTLTVSHSAPGNDIKDTRFVNDSLWHLVVGVAKAGTFFGYVDGILIGSGACSSRSTNTLNIGRYNGSLNFPGIVEDVRIYDRAISAGEVGAMYNPATRWQLRYQPGRVSYYSPVAATNPTSPYMAIAAGMGNL